MRYEELGFAFFVNTNEAKANDAWSNAVLVEQKHTVLWPDKEFSSADARTLKCEPGLSF